MLDKKVLTLTLLAHIKFPGKKHIPGSLFVTDEHLPRIQKALFYICLNSHRVQLFEDCDHIVEVRKVTADYVLNEDTDFVENLVEALYISENKASAISFMLGSLFQYMIDHSSVPNDDFLTYCEVLIEYFHTMKVRFSQIGKQKLIDKLYELFTEQEEEDFEELIDAMNGTKNMTIEEE